MIFSNLAAKVKVLFVSSSNGIWSATFLPLSIWGTGKLFGAIEYYSKLSSATGKNLFTCSKNAGDALMAVWYGVSGILIVDLSTSL